MKGFARVTKLSNVGGRADYISNPDRQESIVAASEPVDWKPYHDYEMANQKTAARNNEGREVVIALPNEWAALSRDELTRRVQQLAITAAGKDTDMQWAVHWNKAHTNLHVHVIFSERQREKSPGRWDRDIYLTDEGKVARRKADRAKNPDGSFRLPVHRKGDLKDGFTVKDPRYKNRGWVPAMKQQLQEQFAALGVVLEKPQPLHEYHEGKGKEAPTIRAKNEAIRENNANYAGWRKAFPQLKESGLKQLMVKAAKDGKVLYIGRQSDGRLGYGMTTVKEWRAAAAKEQAKAQPQAAQKAPEQPQQPQQYQKPQEQLQAAQRAAEQPQAVHIDIDQKARELSELRQTFVDEYTRSLERSEYKVNPIYQQQAYQIESLSKSAAEKGETIKQLQEQRGKLGFFKGKQKKALDEKIHAFSKYQREDMEKLKALGVDDLSQAPQAIADRRAAAAQEQAKAEAAKQNHGAAERAQSAQAAFLSKVESIPQSQRQAVFERMERIGTEKPRGGGSLQMSMNRAKAEVKARQVLDRALQQKSRVHSQQQHRGHDFDRSR